MVITLDNGQTITIYEQGNLLKQIEPYIDKEIYDLLEDKFSGFEELEFKSESLDEKLVDADEYISELQIKITTLKDRIYELIEDNNQLENLQIRILEQIENIINKSRDNKLAFHEVENMLEEILEEN